MTNRSRRLRVLDACCGTWGFSRGFAERGDILVGVDLDPRSADDAPPDAEFIRADVCELRPEDLGAFDVALFGPPCPEFSSMRHANPRLRGVPPSAHAFSVVEASFRLARDLQPKFWAVENVRGAIKWWSPLYGEPTHRLGAWYLWACLPPTVFPPMPHKLGSRAISKAGRGRVNDLNKSGRERSRTPAQLAETLASSIHAWYERAPFPKPGSVQMELREVVAGVPVEAEPSDSPPSRSRGIAEGTADLFHSSRLERAHLQNTPVHRVECPTCKAGIGEWCK